ncbi:hypothetical protein [Synechococcus sp. LA31]|uniref:hypothetical protein n=1 Tax=Synechococcus sp. LA31 TaxID=2741953 RepID=UPI0035303B53
MAADNPSIRLTPGSMVFNRKGSFFLNLDEKAPAAPATIAPVAQPEAKPAKADQGTPATTLTVSASAAAAPASSQPAAPAGPVLTTAEAIAAELAAEQAAKPVATFSTFAPDCVTAGGSLPLGRRRGGANMAGFRSMAGGLFGKKPAA